MENILYLHYGNGRPAFYVRLEGGAAGAKAVTGKLFFQKGLPVFTGQSVLYRGLSAQKLTEAGYEEICPLSESNVAGVLGDGPLQDKVCQAINIWWVGKKHPQMRKRDDDNMPALAEDSFAALSNIAAGAVTRQGTPEIGGDKADDAWNW